MRKKAEFRGDDKWLLPSVSEKIDKIITQSTTTKKSSSKKRKKEKKFKSKKEKKLKKRKKRKSSSGDCDNDSSSTEEEIRKKKKKRRMSTSSESSNSSNEKNKEIWIEKSEKKEVVREDWLAGMSLGTFEKQKVEKKPNEKHVSLDQYNPGKSTRELNPYWKNGGTGVPTFKKPCVSDDEDDHYEKHKKQPQLISNSSNRGNWRKKGESTSSIPPKQVLPEEAHRKELSLDSSSAESEEENPQADNVPVEKLNAIATADFLTDQQMNELGVKLIKAEIMGNDDLVGELKEKLDRARNYRENFKNKSHRMKQDAHTSLSNKSEEHILLMESSESGLVRPLDPAKDLYGSRGSNKKKRTKVETHKDNERVRYFPDDDKYSLKTMFEREKFTSANDQDVEFVRVAGSHKNRNDDLDDLFSDKVRRSESAAKSDEKAQNRAIREHEQMEQTLENCNRCFDSKRMQKQLIVAMGNHVYLALPSHEGLQTGHCIIAPLQHVTCSTQLDENVWSEVNDFLKALTQMFKSRKMDVCFFETARYLHKKPHMTIHCVPNRNFELLPFYFKKAIQESESDWSTNKQLVELKGDRKDLRRSIPKGLPYFWVNFGIDRGFAHVIENQENFSSVFAQETIGGLLNLDARLWRRPRNIENMISKVKQFAEWWKPFDVTKVD